MGRTSIASEVSSDNTVSRFYVRGYELIQGVDLTNSSNNVFYLQNGHGDVTGLTNASVTVTKSYEYDAFGVEKNKVESDTNPWRYCGEYFDKETDSIYLRARYYNPTTGRFTSEDPIMDGTNWYSYCAGNPIMFVDPRGTTMSPVKDENNNVVDYRMDINHLVEEFNGSASYNAEDKTYTISIFGRSKTVSIDDYDSDHIQVNGETGVPMLLMTFSETFEAVGLTKNDYEVNESIVEVTKGDEIVNNLKDALPTAVLSTVCSVVCPGVYEKVSEAVDFIMPDVDPARGLVKGKYKADNYSVEGYNFTFYYEIGGGNTTHYDIIFNSWPRIQ